MKIDLTGKTAIVTGSTEGIGAACAAGLAEAGASVVLNGRKPAPLEALRAGFAARFPASTITSVAADLSTAEGCDALVAAVPRADILVNNVGIYGPKPFFDISDEEWDRFFQTNVMSGVRLSRAYMKGMFERDWGRVVFISSESGISIPADMIHYGFTKTAQLAVSRGLAKLARGTNVTVNSVLPGPTLTEGVEAMLAETAANEGKTIDEVALAFVKTQRPNSIIQRMATPEEVANMVVYVCSPLASATTGAALRVEGGIVETLV
jgi:NAD(P)-dependent dehydrogenase (short-subunit alcohol dehydrogenase family)